MILNAYTYVYIMSYEYLRREGTKASPCGLQRHSSRFYHLMGHGGLRFNYLTTYLCPSFVHVLVRLIRVVVVLMYATNVIPAVLVSISHKTP